MKLKLTDLIVPLLLAITGTDQFMAGNMLGALGYAIALVFFWFSLSTIFTLEEKLKDAERRSLSDGSRHMEPH